MNWETLPYWIWLIYYGFLLTTLVFTVVSIFKKRIIILSVIALIFTISLPVVNIMNTVERSENTNEIEYLLANLKNLEIWSLYVLLGYVYLLIWWIIFLFKTKKTSVRNIGSSK